MFALVVVFLFFFNVYCTQALDGTSIAVVTSDKTQTRLRLIRDSPKSLVTRLNSLYKGGKSEDLARESVESHQWVAIEFDYRRKEYFVIDRTTSDILVIIDSPGYMNKTHLLFEGISTKVNALAYDWLRRSLYWADPSYQAIFRLSFGHLCEGNSCLPQSRLSKKSMMSRSERRQKGIVSSVIGDGLMEPCAIALDPVKGFLYYADDGSIPTLQMSTLNGKNRTVLSRGLIRPAGLTIDYENNKLYWIERLSGLSVINSCQLTMYVCIPVRVSTVYQSNLYDMDYHQGFVIASDHAVNRLVIYGDTTDQLLRQNWAGKTFGIRVASEDRQPWKKISKSEQLADTDSDIIFPDIAKQGVVVLASGEHGISLADKTFAMSSDQSQVFPLIEENGITTLAMDIQRGRLFYFSGEKKSIVRISLPTHIKRSYQVIKTEVVTSWVETVTGMAVDWSTGNLYWLDSGYHRIMVSRDDGRFARVLHYTNISNPHDLVIHSERKYMFWSDTGDLDPRIERSDLDGYGRKVILNKNVFYERPHALALDMLKDVLYWSDGPFLCRATLDGNIFEDCKRRDYTSKIAVKSLDIMHDYVIWTDFIGGIKSADVDTDFPLTHVTTPTHFPDTYFSDVIYYHVSRQPEVTNPCQKINVSASVQPINSAIVGTNSISTVTSPLDFFQYDIREKKCAHLCLPSLPGAQCACATGYWLKTNGGCVPGFTDDSFLIFCDLRSRQIFRQFTLLKDYYAFPLSDHTHVSDVALDNINKKVYWSDSHRNMIHAMYLNGTQQSVVFAAGNSFNISRIVLAPAHRLLYIVTSSGHVAVLSLITNYFAFVVNNSYWEVSYLAVGEKNRKLYMTANSQAIMMNKKNKSDMKTTGAILTSDMDGTNFEVSLTTQGRPQGITVDEDNILWTDTERRSIYSTSMSDEKVEANGNQTKGKEGRVIVTVAHLSQEAQPGDIIVVKDDVYFTDRSKQAIQRFTLNKPAVISDSGFPFLNDIRGLNFYDTGNVKPLSAITPCDGIWIPKPLNSILCLCNGITEKGATIDTHSNLQCQSALTYIEKVSADQGLCLIKPQVHGRIHGGQIGTFVLPGQKIVVKCDPGFKLTHTWHQGELRKCVFRQWSSASTCSSALTYKIIGNSSLGYVVLKKATTFVVPRGIHHVDVICIGGGGGGYDACDKQLRAARARAGMGGVSKFGKYLRAYGGLGGSLHEGGRGGRGRTLFGGKGQLSSSCLGGGAAGETQSSQFCHLSHTSCPFCGAGGAMPSCSICPIRPGGCGGPGSETGGEPGAADNYGGGATGMFGGGSGGGGAFSRMIIRVSSMEQIPVKVGRPGLPSAKPAGQGVVVVGWGSRLEKLIPGFEKKAVCKPFTYKLDDENANDFLERCFS